MKRYLQVVLNSRGTNNKKKNGRSNYDVLSIFTACIGRVRVLDVLGSMDE